MSTFVHLGWVGGQKEQKSVHVVIEYPLKSIRVHCQVHLHIMVVITEKLDLFVYIF